MGSEMCIRDSFKNIDGYNIHYTDIGTGQPIVLLHSQPANERQFDVLKNALKENYRVISIDRPGMGYSEGPKINSSERPVSYTHLRAHETDSYLVCRLLLE